MIAKTQALRLLAAATALTAFSAPQAGFAQEATAATADAEGTGEIVVTARRREESLVDVPISVSAISGDALNRSGAIDITTLQDKMALRIEQSREEGRQLIGIFARVASPKGQVLSISAREGRFLALKDSPDTIILRLTDGQIVQDAPGQAPRVLQR